MLSVERSCLDKLDRAFRIDVGMVKVSVANTLRHECAKLEVAYELALRGHKFVTEARFKGGMRADVYCISNDEVWEIETKYTPEMVEKKKGLYPVRYVWVLNPSKDILKQM